MAEARLLDPGIELILGPMMSEKTTEMLSRVRRLAYAGHAGVIVKWLNDTRYSGEPAIVTHSLVRQETSPATAHRAPIRVVVVRALAEVTLAPEELAVGVDEGQFFEDLPEWCDARAFEGRRVIVAALDGTYARRPFGRVGELLPLCECVAKLQGVCMVCRCRPSAFSQRLVAGREEILIGGSEKYRSVCRHCYSAAAPPAAAAGSPPEQ